MRILQVAFLLLCNYLDSLPKLYCHKVPDWHDCSQIYHCQLNQVQQLNNLKGILTMTNRGEDINVTLLVLNKYLANVILFKTKTKLYITGLS